MRLTSVVLWLSIAAVASAQQPTLDFSGLDDPDASVRVAAAKRIGQMGAGEAAVEPLRDALRDAEPAVRVAAAEALGLTGRSARAAASSLREGLRDHDPKVRSAAAMALGRATSPKNRPLRSRNCSARTASSTFAAGLFAV